MAKLILKRDGINLTSYPLDDDVTGIGRDADNQVHIDDFAVSGMHAEVQIRTNPYLDNSTDYYLVDLGSTNGTFVNEEKIDEYLLKQGDVIRVGSHEFTFDSGEATGHERTAIYLPDDEN